MAARIEYLYPRDWFRMDRHGGLSLQTLYVQGPYMDFFNNPIGFASVRRALFLTGFDEFEPRIALQHPHPVEGVRQRLRRL